MKVIKNGDRVIYTAMKDGSKIQLYSSGGAVGVQYLKPEMTIDLEQVDHVILADGTKLFPINK